MKKIALSVFTLLFFTALSPVLASSKATKYTANYMQKLQKRIKNNWHPPKRKESYVVIAKFDLGLDGKIIGDVKFDKILDDDEIMKAARKAISHTAPFKKIKKKYIKETVGIEFKFEYNVMTVIDDDGDLPIHFIRQKK